MFRSGGRRHDPRTASTAGIDRGRTEEDTMATTEHRRRPDQGGAGRRPDRPALGRPGSRTRTSPGWSSATSTPRAACSAGGSSCSSRTAPPTTPSPPRRPRSWSSSTGSTSILGGILSSTRQAIKRSAVIEGKTLYIYPEQYEGQESDPLIFCTGPVPAQQVDPLVPWLMRRDRGEDVLPAVGRLHLAARDERARPRGRDRQRRLDRRRGVLPARSRRLPGDGRADRRQRRRRRCST